MLTEWKRVLAPGGQLILELPCMDKIFYYIHRAMTQRQPMEEFMSWFPIWGDPKYQDPKMCHKWGYTKNMLQELLDSVGFEAITLQPPRYHFPMRDMRAEAIKGGL